MANPTARHHHLASMTHDQRKQEYLDKAKEAEDQAERARDEQSKAAWLRIAAGYHDLAARQDHRL